MAKRNNSSTNISERFYRQSTNIHICARTNWKNQCLKREVMGKRFSWINFSKCSVCQKFGSKVHAFHWSRRISYLWKFRENLGLTKFWVFLKNMSLWKEILWGMAIWLIFVKEFFCVISSWRCNRYTSVFFSIFFCNNFEKKTIDEKIIFPCTILTNTLCFIRFFI